MLVGDVDLDLASRPRLPVLPQLLFAGCAMLVAVAVVLTMPTGRTSTLFWSGASLTVLTTFATATLPWRRVGTGWLLVVPCLDLLALALLRQDLLPELASVWALASIPILWMGVDFGGRGVLAAVVASLAVAVGPEVLTHGIPGDAASWMRAAVVGAQALGLAGFGHLFAVQLRTRRRSLDRELEESRRTARRGRTILQTVGSGICFYDADGSLVFANSQARALAARGGYDLERPDRPGTRVWAPDGRTALGADEQALLHALAEEGLSDAVEWVGPAHDLTAVAWNSRQVVGPDGSPQGTVVVSHDVTSLLAAHRTQERFLGTVSHELRTPLTSIVGFVEVAETLAPGDAEALRRALSAIRRNSDSLALHLGDLITVAEDRPRVDRERVDVGGLVADALDRWSPQCRDLGLDLRPRVERGALADVDRDAFSRVLDSLISNAVKFTPPGGHVRVQLTTTGHDVVLQVVDTGIGMSATDRDRAFEWFHRGEHARAEQIRGMGMGLPAVRRIVEAHDGHVQIESAPQRGTTVTVRLPRPRP